MSRLKNRPLCLALSILSIFSTGCEQAAPPAAAQVQTAASPASTDPADGDGRPVFPPTDPIGLPVPAFRLTERNGEVFDTASLKGKVWIASFFYTSCPGPCLKLNQAIERLLRDTRGEDVTVVSISVDPANDTPDVLSEYTKNFQFDPKRWLFLTGHENEIFKIAYEIFRVPAERAAHSEKLILIGPDMTIDGYYHAMTDAQLVALKARIKRLLHPTADRPEPAVDAASPAAGGFTQPGFSWRQLPAVNAALNATASVLLVVGLLLIKSGHERAHRNTMLTAFGVSVVFLICYLTYHQMLKMHDGSHGKAFTGPSPVRELYYGLLISHVVLAAAVPFLAVRTIYLGLRDRRAEHRRAARWTFPIWLYVSLTGVVIYYLLYHAYPST